MKKLFYLLTIVLILCSINVKVIGQTETDTLFYATTSCGIFEFDPSTNLYTSKIYLGANTYTSGSLTLYNGKFYGLTYTGGQYDKGTIFEFDPSTNSYTTKIDFVNGSSMGCAPYGSLTLYNDKFYGMTYSGGQYNKGTMFEWDPSKNVFTKQADFNGTNGANSQGTLVLVLQDGKFYGMTLQGGSSGQGVIFEWDLSNPNVINKKIDLNATTGWGPYGNLTYYNGKFYGLQMYGGSNSCGTIFEWNPSTNVYAVKFNFNSTSGKWPLGTLVLKNDIFYGMTWQGGNHDLGTIFQWIPSTNIFMKRIDFNGIDGAKYTGSYSLVYNYGKFYAMTTYGGIDSVGVIYKWDPITNDYNKLYDFTPSNGLGKPYSEFSFYPITTPTIQASDVSVQSTTTSSINIKWTNGNGQNRVVFIKQDSVGSAYPINHETYVPDTIFGSGSQIDGWYCVFDGVSDSVTVTNLLQNTNYRVMVCEYNGFLNHKLYNTNTANGNPVNIRLNTTINVYTVTTISNPINGGILFGGGQYNQGDTVTITATANSSFEFVNWTENNIVESDTNFYVFIIDTNRYFVANFVPLYTDTIYTVTTVANPTNGGVVSGGGQYTQGDRVSVTAVADSSFMFVNWTENDVVVSDSSVYTFVINSNRNFVANFDTVVQVTLHSSPPDGGSTTGGGSYTYGSDITLNAIPNDDWEFFGWTQDCKLVSKDKNYSFKVTYNVNLVAHFYEIGKSFVVLSEAYPIDGGYTTGGCETYPNGTEDTVEAFPNNGWKFVYWKNDNGDTLSKSSQIIIKDENVHLIAVFEKITGIEKNKIQQVKIFPNPTAGQFRIQSDKAIRNIVIYNFMGQQVGSLQGENTELTFDISNFGKGIYYLRIIIGDRPEIHKVVVL